MDRFKWLDEPALLNRPTWLDRSEWMDACMDREKGSSSKGRGFDSRFWPKCQNCL